MDSKLKKVLDKMSKVINQIDGLDPFIRVMEDKAESLIELDYTVDDICEYFYKEFNLCYDMLTNIFCKPSIYNKSQLMQSKFSISSIFFYFYAK